MIYTKDADKDPMHVFILHDSKQKKNRGVFDCKSGQLSLMEAT